MDALKDPDPRLREQAVRILGRDDRENGHVEYLNPDAKLPPAALGTSPRSCRWPTTPTRASAAN